MPVAATICGRVVDSDGQPVANADVWLRGVPSNNEPFPGVLHAKSDRNGRFAIQDAHAWKAPPPKDLGNGTTEVVGPMTFFVKGKGTVGFGIARPTYNEAPTDVGDVVLAPEAVIEGRVTDNGQPVPGILVSMQSYQAGWAETLTNADGRYRLDGLTQGKCNLWVQSTEAKTCIAVDSLPVVPGKAAQAPDIQMVAGGWIAGKIVDQAGAPVTRTVDGRPHQIGLYGPARPKSGAAIQSFPVNPDGTFRFRVPPGENRPYVCTGWNPKMEVLDTVGKRFRDGWVPVEAGETRQITILYPKESARTGALIPSEEEPEAQQTEGGPDLFSDPEVEPLEPGEPADDVRLPMSLKAEAKIAAWVRHYGGWYDLDDSKHIVSVNMVYHEDEDGKRSENSQRDAHAILQHLPELAHLRHLYLHERQATDATMKYVGQLPHLETFFVWDAKSLTDDGVAYLSGLPSLKNVHLSNGRHITDISLAILAQLPRIEKLSLQGNRFTDRGIDHVLKARQLQHVWLGLGESKFSPPAITRLLELPNLKVLDVQGSEVADEAKEKFVERKITVWSHQWVNQPDQE